MVLVSFVTMQRYDVTYLKHIVHQLDQIPITCHQVIVGIILFLQFWNFRAVVSIAREAVDGL